MSKQKHEQFPFGSSPNYNIPSEELGSKKPDSTLRKWGKNILLTAVTVGALFGAERAVSASNESEHQEATRVNEQFQKELHPAAEKIADDAMAGYERSNNDGYMLEDSKDPTKHNISFHGTLENGTKYNLTATVGEDTAGNVDTSKVERAEIVKTDRDNLQTSMFTIKLQKDVMNGEPQWVASSGVKTQGLEAQGVTSAYFGSTYEDLDQNLQTAKNIARDVNEELEGIESDN